MYLLDGNKLFLNYSSDSYPSGVDAGDNDTLTKQSTSTSDNSSSGSGIFVAVGNSGKIVRSTDNGSSLDNATSPTANNLNGVTYLSKNCTVAGQTLNYSLGKCSGTLTLTSIEDSYVSDGQVNTNFGSSSSLLIDADPTSYEIFIKSPEIDQIPSGATVSSATLVLTSFNSGSTAEARQVVTAWDENSITWNNRPTDDAGQFTTINTSSGTVNINVKAAVEAWISGASNHGLRLRSSGGDGSDFRSSEYTTANQRPSFVIDLSY